MKSFFPKFSLVVSILCLLGSNLQTAQSLPTDDTIVKHLPTLAALTGSDWSNKQTIYVEGDLAANDGFQGTFNLKTNCPLSGGVDGGLTCVNDSQGHHFVRTNFNATIQQAGAVVNSVYDCNKAHAHTPATCTRADTILANAVTAAQFYSWPGVSTKGAVIALASTFTSPAGMTVNCESGNIGKINSGTADYTALGGTIYLDHGASLTHADNSAGYQNCVIVHQDYYAAFPLTTIRKQDDFWGPAGSVVTHGDTGVICPTEGCNDNNLLIIGFDTCYENSTSGQAIGDKILGDCNVGLVGFHNKGTRQFSHLNFFPYTVHNLTGVTDGAGTTTWNDDNSEWWTPTNIVNDGTGKCKVTSTQHSTADIHTGDIVVISNLPSRESCEGEWVVTKSGSDLVLNGSSYVGPTTTGSFTAGRNTVWGIADMMNIYFGQTITGVAGITNGSVVVDFDPISKFVALSCGDITVICVTGSGSGVSIAFANDTASTFSPGACSGNNPDTCIFMTFATRMRSGNSNGGVKSGHLGTCIMLGGPSAGDSDVGMMLDTVHCYAMERQVHVQNSTAVTISAIGSDNEKAQNNYAQNGFVVDGSDSQIRILGKGIGSLGIGIVINNSNTDNRAVEIQNTSTGGARVALQVDGGSVFYNINSAAAGDILIGHGAGNVAFGCCNSLPHADLYAENDLAQAKITGGQNFIGSGYIPVINNNTADAKITQTATATLGSLTLTGATLDTTAIFTGQKITGPAGVLVNPTYVDTATPGPCVPSCVVSMTRQPKTGSVGGSFKFAGNAVPPPQAVGAASRMIAEDIMDAFVETDAFGGRPSYMGVRYDGSMGALTAVQAQERLNGLVGRGYDGSSIPIDDAGVFLNTLEIFTSSTHGTYVDFRATQKGTINAQQVGRIETGGLRVGPTNTAAVMGLVTAESNVYTTTSSDINSLSTGGTGDITVGATAGFPSPTALLIDHEIVAAIVKDSTHFTVQTRGIYGTSGVAHSNGSIVSFSEEMMSRSQSTLPNFAAFSNGNTWTRGHEIYIGSAPTPSGTIGTGSAIAGNDNVGVLTVGSSPGSGTITLTFNVAWTLRPVCFFQDETTAASNPIRPTTIDTTHAVLTSASGSFAANDNISWNCAGYK